MLTIDNTALLIIDVQGNLAEVMYEKESLFGNLRKLVLGAKVLGLPIVWAEQIPEKLGKTITQLSELLPDINPIAKNTFSCMCNEHLQEAVAATGRRKILVCGIEAHICVYQTVRDLLGSGYQAQVVVDAVSSRTEVNKSIGIEKMRSHGADITSVETALFELLQVAEGAKFKEILKIVK